MEDKNKSQQALLQGEDLHYFDDVQATDTLANILQRAAFSAPDRGIMFIADNSSETWMSYSELYLEAQSCLAGLQSRGVRPGNKLIVQVSDKRSFLIVYWACLLGGIIPAPLASTLSLDPQKATFEKLIYIWNLLDQPLIITDYIPPNLQQALSEAEAIEKTDFAHKLLELGASSIRVVLQESLNTDTDADARLHQAEANDIAFLQFTSGSTGHPKGVMLSHANLIANMHSIVQGAQYGSNERAFNWMPFYHDMGLIGSHLAPLLALMSSYQMSPFTFIKKPLLWLQKIHTHRITITASPNFGYQRILEKVTDEQLSQLDLSCLRRIFNGAEPISVSVMQGFVERLVRFAQLDPQAMCPVYGMAEACLGVSSTPSNEDMRYMAISRSCLSLSDSIEALEDNDPDAILFASEGKILNGMQLRIVDDADHILESNQVGNIQISGPNMTSGYYQNASATEALLCDDWRRTGDLGFVREGYLYITGRAKDIIFIGGQNFYAHDLEQVALEIESLSSVAAIGYQDEQDGLEQVIVFAAIDSAWLRQKSDKELASRQVLSIVRDRINQYFGFSPDFLVSVKNSEIHKTTSGKLQRYRLLADFKNGKYLGRALSANDLLNAETPVIESLQEEMGVPTREKLISLVRQGWSEVLKLPLERIGLNDSFFHLGGTSIKAVEVIALAEEYTHCTIPQHAFTDFNTINGIVDYIMETQQSSRLSARVSSLLNDQEKMPDEALQEQQYKTGQDEQAEINTDEDIAIIGMSCRFPGAYNIRRFWEVLSEGRDCITEIPSDRWSIGELYQQPQGTQRNKSQSKWGGFIEDIRYFDSEFFNIKEDEAEQMDPQQRLFLEIAWLALENAGYAKTEDNNIGIFVGAGFNGYIENFINRFDVVNLHESTITGNLLNMIAARVSHTFNLSGPALTVDTACSSSLVAVHLARQSILSGECDMALAGGIQLNLTAAPYILFSQAGALSPDGHCHAFAENANGFVPGEGAGAVVLKSWKKAVADGDRIYAVIKGSAMNNDGHSLGIMAPNPQGQEAVIRQAYQNSKVDPRTISSVEAHGVGTPVSDMVEVKALSTLFAEAGMQHGQCALGSVKANIGHLLSASGIAALIKTVLSLEHQQLPASLHCQQERQSLRLEKSPFYVNHHLKQWDTRYSQRRAAVHSFGFGGTNCHLVLEEALKPERTDASASNFYQLVTFSAHHADAFAKEVSNLRTYLRNHHEDTHLADICYTQNAKRSHFWEYRAAFVTNSVPHLRLLLSQFKCDMADKIAESQEIQFAAQLQKPSKKKRALVFMSTGEGQQFPQMGRMFYAVEPAFRAAVESCQEALKHSGVANLDLLWLLSQAEEDERLYQIPIADVLTFVMDYALAKLWMHWGILPGVLTGYGLGEYVAICLAGGISLEDALSLVYQRGELLQKARLQGGCLRVCRDDLSSDVAEAPDLAEVLAKTGLEVHISAKHDAQETVVSGDFIALHALQRSLPSSGFRGEFLCGREILYSPQRVDLSEDFRAILDNIQFHSLDIPVFSSGKGDFLTDHDLGAEWIVRHLQQPIDWQASITSLQAQGFCNFLETGCGAQLSNITARLIDSESWSAASMPEHDWLSSIAINRLKDRRNQGSSEVTYERRKQRDDSVFDVPYRLHLQKNQRQHIIKTLGDLYVRGMDIDWAKCYYRQCQPLENSIQKATWVEESSELMSGRLINIPTYPFQRKMAWVKAQGEQRSNFQARQGGLQQSGLGRYRMEATDPLLLSAGGPTPGRQCAWIIQAYKQAYGNIPDMLEKIRFNQRIDPNKAMEIVLLQDQQKFTLSPAETEADVSQGHYTEGQIDSIELLPGEVLRLQTLQQGMQIREDIPEYFNTIPISKLYYSKRAVLAYIQPIPKSDTEIYAWLLNTGLQLVNFFPLQQEDNFRLNLIALQKLSLYKTLPQEALVAYIQVLEEGDSWRCHISLCNLQGDIGIHMDNCYLQKQGIQKLPEQKKSHLSLEEYLAALAAEKLACAVEDIDMDSSFLDMGANSVMALSLVKELEQALEVELSPTLLFEYSTLNALKEYLLEVIPDREVLLERPDSVDNRLDDKPEIRMPAPEFGNDSASNVSAYTKQQSAPQFTAIKTDANTAHTLSLLEATIKQQRQDQMQLFDKQLETLKQAMQYAESPATSVSASVVGEEVLALLLQYCAEKLQCPLTQLHAGAGWMEQGGNSLQALELVSALEQHYSLTLSKTLFFDYPSLEAIAAAVQQRLQN